MSKFRNQLAKKKNPKRSEIILNKDPEILLKSDQVELFLTKEEQKLLWERAEEQIEYSRDMGIVEEYIEDIFKTRNKTKKRELQECLALEIGMIRHLRKMQDHIALKEPMTFSIAETSSLISSLELVVDPFATDEEEFEPTEKEYKQLLEKIKTQQRKTKEAKEIYEDYRVLHGIYKKTLSNNLKQRDNFIGKTAYSIGQAEFLHEVINEAKPRIKTAKEAKELLDEYIQGLNICFDYYTNAENRAKQEWRLIELRMLSENIQKYIDGKEKKIPITRAQDKFITDYIEMFMINNILFDDYDGSGDAEETYEEDLLRLEGFEELLEKHPNVFRRYDRFLRTLGSEEFLPLKPVTDWEANAMKQDEINKLLRLHGDEGYLFEAFFRAKDKTKVA